MAEIKPSGFKWAHPSEWLDDKINDATVGELASIARALAGVLDGDQIQDLFQSEMDYDGYFTPEDEDKDDEDEA